MSSSNVNTGSVYPFSFYVPRIHNKWNEAAIMGVFQYEYIGKVDRVDFGKPLEGKPELRSAFIHMDYYVPGHRADEFLRNFCQNGSRRFYPMPAYPEFWLLLPNKNPVYRTHMNIHQLAALCENQEKAIAELREEIKKLKNVDVVPQHFERRKISLEVPQTPPQTPPYHFRSLSPPPAPRKGVLKFTNMEVSSDDEDYDDMPDLIPA